MRAAASLPIFSCAASLARECSAKELNPGEPMDYGKMSFNPARWAEKKVDPILLPWEDSNVGGRTGSRRKNGVRKNGVTQEERGHEEERGHGGRTGSRLQIQEMLGHRVSPEKRKELPRASGDLMLLRSTARSPAQLRRGFPMIGKVRAVKFQ
jgi:hypothetical protein